MALDSISRRLATALPVAGIVLALANWNARPAAAWAWAAAVAMLLIMLSVPRRWQLALRRSPGQVAAIRAAATITGAVAFGALMMVIPLAVTLAHAHGIADDPDSGRRATMIVLGAYLVMTGNAMPRMLPPIASMRCDGARVQAFQRLAGWTWTLCGLGFIGAWLALPIGAAEPVSTTVVVAAMIVTIVQVVRLRRPRQHTAA